MADAEAKDQLYNWYNRQIFTRYQGSDTSSTKAVEDEGADDEEEAKSATEE